MLKEASYTQGVPYTLKGTLLSKLNFQRGTSISIRGGGREVVAPQLWEKVLKISPTQAKFCPFVQQKLNKGLCVGQPS